MVDPKAKDGVAHVLIERFEKHRLPRILSIKENVDEGATLSDLDIAFLEEVFRDAQQNKHLADAVPECQSLFARMVHLYNEITDKALKNEEQ
ncbi:MAG: hypothetical protein U9Q81_19985 [Pseudomonadota bacterium]|nr:hypothetical protein [Pseudomonadota bacterium]